MDKNLSNRFANMSLLCAILVVSIHIGHCDDVGAPAWYFSQIVSYGIAGMAIPFFFFASGYFLAAHCGEGGWWKRALANRTKTLLLPYFAWCALFYLFDNSFCLLANVAARAELARNLYWNGVPGLFGLNVFAHPALFVLWYVRALFLLVLVSPLVVAAIRKLGWWALLPLFAVYAHVVPGDESALPRGLLPFKWTFSLLGLFYFSLGICLRVKNVAPALPRKVSVICLLMGCALLAAQVCNRLAGVSWPVSPRPFMVMLLAAGLFSLLPAVNLPGWLKGCAFPIYILHCFCRVVPWTFLPASLNRLAALVLTWGATALLCIVVAAAMRRMFPRATGLLFGGR